METEKESKYTDIVWENLMMVITKSRLPSSVMIENDIVTVTHLSPWKHRGMYMILHSRRDFFITGISYLEFAL